MTTKKTEMIHIRLTTSEKKELLALADEKMTDVSTMMRKMAAILCKASRKYGTRLIWPPEFNYHVESVTMQEKIMLAAEKREKYAVKKSAV